MFDSDVSVAPLPAYCLEVSIVLVRLACEVRPYTFWKIK